MPRNPKWPRYAAFLLWLTNPRPDGAGLSDATALARAGALSGLYDRGVTLSAEAVAAEIALAEPGRRAYLRAAWSAYAAWRGLPGLPDPQSRKRPGRRPRAQKLPPDQPETQGPPPPAPPPPTASPAYRQALEAAVGLCRGPWGIGSLLLHGATWADVAHNKGQQVRLRWPDGRLTDPLDEAGLALLATLHQLRAGPELAQPLLPGILSAPEGLPLLRQAVRAAIDASPEPREELPEGGGDLAQPTRRPLPATTRPR